jgi:hypothetical protein
MRHPLPDYSTMLLYYSRRQLTNQGDVLEALGGIMRRISDKAKCRFLDGIPTAAFDAFLLWRSTSLVRRRRGFPSYSWAGWQGWTGYYVNLLYVNETLNTWLEDNTWIVWYKRRSSGPPSLVWDPAANESFPASENGENYPGYRKRRHFRPTADNPIKSTVRTYPTEALRVELPPLPYAYLQFWTLSVRLKVKLDTASFGGEGTIYDTKRIAVGSVVVDGLEETTFFESEGPFEFAVLSEDLSDDPRYFVMLLEGNGCVVERRGLGAINQSAVGRSWGPGPEWKEFLLW